MRYARELLEHAKVLIDQGQEECICYALSKAYHRLRQDLPNGEERCALLNATGLLQQEIEEALGFYPTLTLWVTAQGIGLSANQARLCRMAWIDKMLEAH